MSYRQGSQPIAGRHLVRTLEEFRSIHPECPFTVLVDERGDTDHEVVVFEGARPLAQIKSKGFPAPFKDRLAVRVVKDWPPALGEILRHADARLGGELRPGYREFPLRAHNVSRRLRDLAATATETLAS